VTSRLSVWVQPGASRSRIVGLHGGAVKVAVAAPPEKGRANREVEETVARALGLRRSCVRVLSGVTTRSKVLEIEGLAQEDLDRQVASWSDA
jgi:uncharacterized protein (TIGR00251 family)